MEIYGVWWLCLAALAIAWFAPEVGRSWIGTREVDVRRELSIWLDPDWRGGDVDRKAGTGIQGGSRLLVMYLCVELSFPLKFTLPLINL